MTRVRLAAASILGAAGLFLSTAGLAASASSTADTPREAQARAYVDALVSHNAAGVRFAPNATRVEAGIQTGYSGQQLSNDLTNGPQYQVIQKIRDLAMTETGNIVLATYYLEAGIANQRLATVFITESFDIPDGTIHRIVADIRPVGVL